MIAWQTTRNTYEAAALASLDIALRAVKMTHYKSGAEYTDWNLARTSSVDPARQGRAFITGVLRRDFNNGTLQGELATQPLHPYLIALRTMHNRSRLLDAQKGKSMRLVEAAPGSYLLEHGTSSMPTEATLTTADQDLALALIGVGHALLTLTHNGTAHVYTLARYALAPELTPHAPRADAQVNMTALRSNALFPARRWEPFAIAIHALHCLRELRKHQQSAGWITVAHKTYLDKGAAFRADAPGHTLAKVQQRLGLRIA